MSGSSLPLVLASSSRFRAALLGRLKLPFTQASPDINEAPQPGEAPEQLAIRLAETKARALATDYPEHLIIGSDQTAVSAGKLLGKPGTKANAIQQLRIQSGNTSTFYTVVSLYNTETDRLNTSLVATEVTFRPLSDQEIACYLERENPLQCAGSFMSEGLGISLFEKLTSPDPTALIGLPLMELSKLLREAGIRV